MFMFKMRKGFQCFIYHKFGSFEKKNKKKITLNFQHSTENNVEMHVYVDIRE